MERVNYLGKKKDMKYGKQLSSNHSLMLDKDGIKQFIEDMWAIGVPVSFKTEDKHNSVFWSGCEIHSIHSSYETDRIIPRHEFLARLFNNWKEPEAEEPKRIMVNGKWYKLIED